MTVPPLHREIVVDAGPAEAFAVFVDGIGTWWPMGGYSVFGAQASVAFVDGQLVETGPDGSRAVWGSVVESVPGSKLQFTWHPGQDTAQASQVTVTFTAAAEDTTLVVLEHTGWEVFSDPQAARAEYENGWPGVLAAYTHAVSPTWTWVALVNSPGPAASPDVSLFAQPLFAEHRAFLGRMHAKGYLVGAGPLLDAEGSGMAVLRLPGADRLEEATRLANEDDLSVVQGFFTVQVRPWQVLLSGLG